MVTTGVQLLEHHRLNSFISCRAYVLASVDACRSRRIPNSMMSNNPVRKARPQNCVGSCIQASWAEICTFQSISKT